MTVHKINGPANLYTFDPETDVINTERLDFQ